MNENEVAQNTVVDVNSNNQVLDSNNNFSEIENSTQDITFEETNYGSVESILTKSETLKRTFLPIVEVALIRLLGTSDAYKRKSLNVNLENNEFKVAFQYFVSAFVGLDVDIDAIKADANNILKNISIASVKVNKCEIDCTKGTITIEAIIL